MAAGEFETIEQYFKRNKPNHGDVILGVGDDAAITTVPEGKQLVMSMDTLVEGVHFPRASTGANVGHKALAVNLSDLAAMGAEPAWVTLSLTLPSIDNKWLDDFCDSFFRLLDGYKMQLIGGDMTQGPLSVTCQVHGFVDVGKAILRSGAKIGDCVYVTGTLGDAGLGLQQLENKVRLSSEDAAYALTRYYHPMPRVWFGNALCHIANSAIDVSDGFAADLSHILTMSEVGAEINVNDLPLSNALRNNLSEEEAIQMALSAGDDYELCFTAGPSQHDEVLAIAELYNLDVAVVGKITVEPGLRLLDNQGQIVELKQRGYQHF